MIRKGNLILKSEIYPEAVTISTSPVLHIREYCDSDFDRCIIQPNDGKAEAALGWRLRKQQDNLNLKR